MRIIDEKGRLFGKVNIIDFIVVLFLLCLLPMLIFGYKIFTKKTVLEMPSAGLEMSAQGKTAYENQTLSLTLASGRSATVSFSAKRSSVQDRSNARYEWKIGGTTVSSSRDFNYNLGVGTQQINLTVKDNYRQEDSAAGTVVVNPPKKFIEIELDCKLIRIKSDILKILSIGDQELDKDRKVIGEIIGLSKSIPYIMYEYEYDIGGGQKIAKEIPRLKQLKAKLKLKAEIKENSLYYKGRVIKAGSSLEFKTDKYNIVFVPFFETIKKEKEIVIRLKVTFANIIPEIAESVKPGDKQIEVVENGKKRVVAEIARVVSYNPAEFITLMEDRKTWSILEHPRDTNLVLEIDTLCVRKPEGLFLKNRGVKMGRTLEFSSDLYSITGKIIGIEIR